MLRLYRAPWSTNVERVALALAHKGIEVKSVVIEYADRSAVEAVSGQGLVPVIDDDGHVVHDSHAIIRYLEERRPDPPLFPAESPRRAELDVFMDWFDRVWKHLFEQMLDGRDHLLGQAFSAADCVAFPFLKYARGREAEDTEAFHAVLDEHQSVSGRPRLAAWIECVDARPRAYSAGGAEPDRKGGAQPDREGGAQPDR